MRKVLLVVVLAAESMLSSANAASVIPNSVSEKIREGLPMSFYAFPKSPTKKIYPLKSETRRQVDRSTFVELNTTELLLTSFSEDGKCVEVSIPAGKNVPGRTNRWFKIEDVLSLGLKKSDWTNALTKATTLVYSPYGAKRPTLIGSLVGGVPYLDLGVRKVGRDTFTFAILNKSDTTADGDSYSSRLVYLKDRLPLEDESNYFDRVANMIAEESYQPGVHWDNTVRPLLVKNGNRGCAAFVTDFAKYIFDAENFNRGEQYADPTEIRSGDVIAIKGHYLAVLYRDGDKLHTMEGNFNSTIRRSTSGYSLSKGVWCEGGVPKPERFLHGYHFLKFAPNPRLARKLPK